MYKYKYIHIIYRCLSFLKVLKIFLKDIFIVGTSLLVVEYNVDLFIMQDLLLFTCNETQFLIHSYIILAHEFVKYFYTIYNIYIYNIYIIYTIYNFQ